MESGWVKIYRELLNNTIFHNEKLLKVLIWCTLKATHEEYDQLVGRKIVHLQPGQFVTGRFKASEELRLKPSTAWDYLKVLEANNTIDIQSDSKYSVITVVNWGTYQSHEIKSDSNPNNKSTANQHKQEHKNNKKSDSKEPPINSERILALYSQHCPRLPQIRTLDNKRKRILTAWGDLDEIEQVFKSVGQSDFLCGLNSTQWRASFDWIIKPENRLKILEGNYTKRTREEPEQFLNLPEDTIG